MATARPVVATAVGGVPEIVIDGQTGLLVPPGNPKALAEAVIALLENPEQATRMGQAARSRVWEHFTVERMIAETEGLYRKLLAGEELT
jgi:glycosyltransferase involved in cell wall biosynthesis